MQGMLVEDLRFLNNSFRSYALFQDQRNKVAFKKPKNKKYTGVFNN